MSNKAKRFASLIRKDEDETNCEVNVKVRIKNTLIIKAPRGMMRIHWEDEWGNEGSTMKRGQTITLMRRGESFPCQTEKTKTLSSTSVSP